LLNQIVTKRQVTGEPRRQVIRLTVVLGLMEWEGVFWLRYGSKFLKHKFLLCLENFVRN